MKLRNRLHQHQRVHQGLGYCAVTGGDPTGCREGLRVGIFGGIFKDAAECAELCSRCDVCRYVSFSKVMNSKMLSEGGGGLPMSVGPSNPSTVE